jgi:hypothetical protein
MFFTDLAYDQGNLLLFLFLLKAPVKLLVKCLTAH